MSPVSCSPSTDQGLSADILADAVILREISRVVLRQMASILRLGRLIAALKVAGDEQWYHSVSVSGLVAGAAEPIERKVGCLT